MSDGRVPEAPPRPARLLKKRQQLLMGRPQEEGGGLNPKDLHGSQRERFRERHPVPQEMAKYRQVRVFQQ